MLAYAAKAAGRAGSAKTLTLVIAGHALAIAAVLTAKPDLVDRIIPDRTTIINVPVPSPPKPVPEAEPQPQQPITQPSFIDQERPIFDMEQPTSIDLTSGPTLADIGAVIGSGPSTVIDPPRHVPVLTGPRLTTSEHALKPPYPLEKRRAEQEANLKLRLTIDARGRVIAVDPVGAADPVFLEAARGHILKAWRYKPATEDGMAVQTTTVISLSFRLEDV